MSTTATLRLTLDVTYEANGEDIGELKRMLEQAVERSIGNGMLTGETAAEVDSWSMKVAEQEEPLDEGDLAGFMAERIENGEWGLEDIPVRLARFGQMDANAFIAEMRERMEQAAAEDEPKHAAPRAGA